MNSYIWVDEELVLALHGRLLALHGGGAGVRDVGLLRSALARPQQIMAYVDAPNVFELAAAYTDGIVNNHPFVDGNKRTGFIVGVLFLELNGFRFAASEPDATQAVLALASGEISSAEYQAFLSANSVVAK